MIVDSVMGSRGVMLVVVLMLAGCVQPRASFREGQGSAPPPSREGAGPVAATAPEASAASDTVHTSSSQNGPQTEESAPTVALGSSPDFGDAPVETIDFLSALRLASRKTIDVAILRERLEIAKANLDEVTALFLPRLQVGGGYMRHDGRLQQTRGDVFDVTRSSLGAVPHVEFSVDPGGAYFERLSRKQLVEAASHGEVRTQAESMVRAAMYYYDLVEALAMVSVARESMAHTTAQVELNQSLVEVEAALRVNLVRAQAELARDEGELHALLHVLRKSSNALATWLRLPPQTVLRPAEDRIKPLPLVDTERGAVALVESALARRPDLHELEALRAAANEAVSGARWTPWLPEVSLFAGYGVYGGGRSGFVGDFGDRFDAGAGITWTFDGLGFVDAARVRRARAEANEASLRLAGLREQIAADVINNFERIRSLQALSAAARSRIRAAEEALELVRARAQAGDAIQIEILDAIRDLAQARAQLVRSITDFNRVHYLLFYQVEGSAWSDETARR